MKKSVFMILTVLSAFFAFKASAEGLPANPWAKGQHTVDVEKQNSKVDELGKQAIEATTDIWSKVRDSKEFRQWKMPQQANTNVEQSANKESEERNNLLTMLSNLNRVGYKMPSNYKNIVGNAQNKSKNNSFSYDKMMRQWQLKYNNTKNNSLNILNNSYQRMLSTIRNSTGVDVNRVINESVNAFK